ncbi:tetratricopeptide repeat protein [Roseimicrobium sp. ORNL1]|uniref:tetratricopeptide repeat protein n=1 Tax=Roseimicrobium sp. ORNL1 TaxID=2711231 RepID=UPI0013E1E36F|nr:tetratricopeptide repeat protein [Roseimicrobium sp. ORNL1]QIF00719.1 tetratricopeptide repeat protein [Roseimicrobium sp. ORNL1]
MPRLPLLVLSWLLCSLALAPAQSGSVGGDVFFDGYQLWKQGEKLEQEGKKDSAIRAYLDAYRIISSVSQNYPDWQPDVVGYRLRIVVTGLQRLGYNVSGLNAAPAAPVQQVPVMPATSAPLPMPPVPQPGTYAVTPQAPMQAPTLSPGTSPVDALNQQFQQQQQKIQELERSNQKLLQDLDVYSRGYMGAAQERDQLKGMQSDLMKRMESMNKEASSSDVATQQELQRLRSESKIVNDMLAAKTKEFEESGKVIESLQKEKAAIMEDQKKLTAELEDAKKGNAKPEEMTKLIAENTRIKKELETAKAQVEKLKSESEKKDQEIVALKTQITGIQSELAKLRQENTAYQTQVAELTMKYKEMSKELASSGKSVKSASPEDAKAAEENKALRAIIMRQLRQQERARQAKELVIAEMKKMESTSQTLMENLEDLTSGKIQISVGEESLFTEPELKEILAASGVTATLEARSGMAAPPSAPAQAPEAAGSDNTPKPAAPPASVNGSSEETLMAAADSAILRSDYVAAEQSLQDALRVNPKNSFALTSLAGIKLRQKKYEEAEVLFQKCLVYSPDNSVAHYSLGVCYFRQNKLSDALNSFEKTVANDRNNSKAHHYLGIIASNMSNRSRAEAEFKSALAIDPNYGDAHFNLAVLYVTSNPPNYEKARQHYQNALDRGIKPDTALERLLKAPGSPAVQTKSATASAQ